MSEGFISLHRKLLEWGWFDDPNTLSVFIYCLLKANWKDKDFRGKTVKRGSFLTSLDDISKKTGVSTRSVRTALNRLKSTNELTITSSRQGTEIKVNNYDKYQQATNETTNERQTSDKRATTTNKDNKEIKEIFCSFWDAYPKKQGKKKCEETWCKKIDSLELAEQVISHVQERAKHDAQWLKDDGQYIPHPTTFINGARWTDKYEVKTQNTARERALKRAKERLDSVIFEEGGRDWIANEWGEVYPAS